MKDFLSISDYSSEELQNLLDLALKLKKEHFAGDEQSRYPTAYYTCYL